MIKIVISTPFRPLNIKQQLFRHYYRHHHHHHHPYRYGWWNTIIIRNYNFQTRIISPRHTGMPPVAMTIKFPTLNSEYSSYPHPMPLTVIYLITNVP